MTTIEAPKTTPKEVTTADVLERAADLLEEFGWIQGPYAFSASRYPVRPPHPEAVCFCMVGALLQAAGDFGTPFDGDIEAQTFALRHLGHTSRWNEEPGRTKSEVVSLLRQAAERSRETA